MQGWANRPVALPGVGLLQATPYGEAARVDYHVGDEVLGYEVPAGQVAGIMAALDELLLQAQARTSVVAVRLRDLDHAKFGGGEKLKQSDGYVIYGDTDDIETRLTEEFGEPERLAADWHFNTLEELIRGIG